MRSARKLAGAALVGCALWLAGTSPAGASEAPETKPEIRIEQQFPLEGEPMLVILTEAGTPVAGVEIRAHYRPESDVVYEEVAGTTGADGTLYWTPTQAGLVTLKAAWEAEGDSLEAAATLSVRFRRTPAKGILMMVVAGCVLFGGAGLSISRLLRED